MMGFVALIATSCVVSKGCTELREYQARSNPPPDVVFTPSEPTPTPVVAPKPEPVEEVVEFTRPVEVAPAAPVEPSPPIVQDEIKP
jgi:hypothetical protein